MSNIKITQEHTTFCRAKSGVLPDDNEDDQVVKVESDLAIAGKSCIFFNFYKCNVKLTHTNVGNSCVV